MAAKTPSSGSKYWYKVSVETVRVWTFLGVLVVLGFLSIQGFGSVRRHFASKQLEVAMDESRNLMERLRTEDDLYHFNNEWSRARTSFEGAREHILAGDVQEALTLARRSRSLLLSIHESLLKRTGGEARFIEIRGAVEYRRGDRGEWTQAVNLTNLYEGDYIKTSGDGSARVMTADGAHFTVRPNTVILVASTKSPESSRREQTIALESGWVNLSTAQSTGRIMTPDAEATVSRRSSAVVSYDQTRRVSQYSVHRGRADVTSSTGQKRELQELEQVTQRAGQLAGVQKIPEAPALLEPSDNLEFAFDAVDEIQLSWEPVQGASRYALQVSTNRLFVENVIDDDNRRKPRARLGVRGEGTFVWRVAAYDSSGAKGPWSLYNRFRVTSPQGATGAL